MKRKLRIGILSLVISILVVAGLPKSWAVDGTTATMSWSGINSINVNQKGDVSLIVSGITGSGLTIAGGVISVADTSCLTISAITPMDGGASANIANGKFAYMSPAGATTNLTFLKVTLQAGSKTCSTSINLSEGRLAFIDTTKLTPATISKTITVKAPSNDATLKTLSPSVGTLSPGFNSGTTNYTISGIPASTGSITFNTSVTDPNASVTSGRTCTLSSKTTTCNIVVKAEDGSTKTYQVVVTKNDPDPVVPTKSNDATLKSLSSSGNTLSPAFQANTTNYTMEAASNAGSVKFDAIPNHEKASIVSGETCTLTGKTTTCAIVVKAEDGTQKTYEVAVTKREEQPVEPAKNSDASLKSLDVSGYTLNPAFNKDTTSYNITVNNNITGLDVSAIPNDEKAKVTISGNTGWKEGINTVRITVIAEDGSEKIYIVNVNRKAASTNTTATPTKSSNNYLANLLVNDGELKPDFNKNNSNYNIIVPNDVEQLDLKAFAEDSKSTINIIGNNNFKIGMNVVTVEVTAEDGSIRVYTLNVNRSEKVNQNKLKDLIVTNGEVSPRFESNVYEYEVTVSGKVNKLDITAIPEFANSNVEIIGNENLREGNNAVLVKVTDENGFVQYYRLNVWKEANNTFLGLTFGQWLMVFGFLCLLWLLIFIILLLLKKKKKDDEEEKPAKPKIPVIDTPSSPVIEFKPEFNFGSKNGTDDDVVEPGGVLNQYTGYPEKELTEKYIETKRNAPEANYEEIPYDPYDDQVTKDEMYDALNEAIESKDPAKLKILYEQERLNREKEALKKAEESKRSGSNRYYH